MSAAVDPRLVLWTGLVLCALLILTTSADVAKVFLIPHSHCDPGTAVSPPPAHGMR